MSEAKFSTEFVNHANIQLAADELLANALLVIAAGRFADGRALMLKLLTPGPWQLSKHSAMLDDLAHWLPLVGYWCGIGCPEIGSSVALSSQEVAALAQEEMERQALFWTVFDSKSPKCVGQGWKMPLVDHLIDMPDAATRNAAFHAFCDDAQEVLKFRLQTVWATALDVIRAQNRAADTNLPADSDFDTLGVDSADVRAPAVTIAPDAQSITSQAIGHATLNFLRKRGLMHTNITRGILRAAMVLYSVDGHDNDAAYFANALIDENPRDLSWLWLLCIPQLRASFASGMCAANLGVTDETMAELMQAVDGRPAAALPKAIASSAFLRDSVQSFAAALTGSSLQGREIVELPILDTAEQAYAIRTSSQRMEDEWHEARRLVAKTGRWPIVTTYGGGAGGNLQERLLEEDYFSRFYFEEAPNAIDISPKALIAAADAVNVQEFLRKKELCDEVPWNFSEYVASELAVTQHYCGESPTEQDVTNARISGEALDTRYRLNRWLLDWELRHNQSVNLEDVRQEWIQDEALILLFLPTPCSWDALAYLNWFNTSDFGAEHYIALGRSWQNRFGAELFAHNGIELKCFVDRPPTNIDDAWVLAREHDLAAQCTLTLPGISVRHHTVGLVNHDRWLLFESP